MKRVCFLGLIVGLAGAGALARIMQEIRIRVDWGSEKMP